MDTKTTAGTAQGGAENETPTTDEAGVDTGSAASTTQTAKDTAPGPERETAAGTGRPADAAGDGDGLDEESGLAPEEADRADGADGADETNGADGADGAYEADAAAAKKGPGVGLGAGAVVSAALGFLSLSGSWLATVASDRQSVVGQLKAQSSQAQSASQMTAQLRGIYGDSWHLTAMIGGGFALVALLVGVFVLVRPAFGAPGRDTSTPWITSVAWGGVVLGVIGLILAVLKLTDAILGLPSVS